MTKKTYIIVTFGVLAVAVLAAFAMVKLRKKPRTVIPETPPPLVRVTESTKQNIQLKVSTFGTVMSRAEIVLSPEVNGKIIEVAPAFQAGGAFKKDDILFKIDPRDYEAAVYNAQAQLAQAEIALVVEEAEGAIALSEWESLGEGEAPALALRKPQLAQAQANLDAARTSLEQARRNLARTEVRAPFSGRVKEKLVDEGQVVAPGTPAARIYATDYAEIRLPLPPTEFNYLGIPLDYDQATHETDAPEVILHGKIGLEAYTWPGRITRAEAQVDPRSRMIYVVARVVDPYQGGEQPPLAVGLFVRAEIKGENLEDVFVLPRSALHGIDKLLVVDKDNRIHTRTVKFYRAGPDELVLKTGLFEGERVCLSAVEMVTEGMHVGIAEEDKQ